MLHQLCVSHSAPGKDSLCHWNGNKSVLVHIHLKVAHLVAQDNLACALTFQSKSTGFLHWPQSALSGRECHKMAPTTGCETY